MQLNSNNNVETHFLHYLKTFEWNKEKFEPNQLGHQILNYQNVKNEKTYDIVLMGIDQDASIANTIRKNLYPLYTPSKQTKIIDIGNLIHGNTPKDTQFAITEIITHFIKQQKIIILLGKDPKMTYYVYKAYEHLEQTLNLSVISPTFAFKISDIINLNNQNYLYHIVSDEQGYLYNYVNIGYQTYLENPDNIQAMQDLHFDICRLGIARQNLENVEPLLRTTDILTFDISSVKNSDAPNNILPLANGFYSEEACQIARYAGMSNNINVAGFYGLTPQSPNIAYQLMSQIIWHFIDGHYKRPIESFLLNSNDYTNYHVQIEETYTLDFYKHNLSNRWWLSIPITHNKYKRHQLLSVAYTDYLEACKNNLTERCFNAITKNNII